MPVTGLAANFSPMPRIAPPPFGTEIVGAETAKFPSAVPRFLSSAPGLSTTTPPFLMPGTSIGSSVAAT